MKNKKHREGGAFGGLTRLRLLRPDEASIASEAQYIIKRAQEHDSRVVGFGGLILFSTQTGDAWMLDPEDGFALCLARNGEPQTCSVFDNPTSFAIEWNADYCIDAGVFVVKERSGTTWTFAGYPTEQILTTVKQIRQ